MNRGDDDMKDIRLGQDDNDDAVIAFNIARLRKRLDLSQTALAERMQAAGQAHWRQNTVSRIEMGKQDLTMGEVGALTGILGSDVLAGTDLDASNQRLSRTFTRAAMAGKLRKIDEALSASLITTGAALATVRTMREVYDASYERQDDGQH